MPWLEPADFRELVSGRRRGLGAGALRTALRGAETPYALAMRLRNWRYDRGSAAISRAAVPVVSVGNLTLGGTGKTPLVAWLARWFRAHDVRVALVSRGYGAQRGGRNDEALELEQQLPDVPHLQDRDRAAAAQIAVEELACQLVILDDGFQHRRLARQLDIVLLDACEPFGFEHVFPRGMLREPLCGLARANVVALSRADMISAERRQHVQERARQLSPQAAWIELRHAPRCYLDSSGQETPLTSLRGERVAAFCGIGNPAGFRHTLAETGLHIAAFREFPDHHDYAREDVESLVGWARTQDAAVAVCTHKDLVKLQTARLGELPLRALCVGIEFLAGQEALEAMLRPLLALVPND